MYHFLMQGVYQVLLVCLNVYLNVCLSVFIHICTYVHSQIDGFPYKPLTYENFQVICTCMWMHTYIIVYTYL